MNNYNPNIHHRRSIRLKRFDYSRAGLYFITIRTLDRKCLFGKISCHDIKLNAAGKFVNECWLQIPEHFPNVVLHEHIVMPDHVHGIIELHSDIVGVQNIEPLQSQNNKRNEFQKIIPRSIGSIVRGFKIGVTKWFRNNTDIENVWQRNYYEHVIQSKQDCKRITDYIKNNPKKWGMIKTKSYSSV